MADFCKQCTIYLFGKEFTNKLLFDIEDDEYVKILCEGCGRTVRVMNDGFRIECNTCIYGSEGTCDNCYGVEGHTTEIAGAGICGNYKRRNNE
jgi:hypothetical protein